jgi:UDP-glucose 4-epimerase
LVTGGAGFIGSHLVERLLADGHPVLVVDNFATGREANLAHLKKDPHLSVERADVADAASLVPLFKGVDWVFHLAALADIVPSIQRPLEYHRANVDGTAGALEAARAAGAKRFVYAASSSCYGLPDELPTPETAEPRPMYPYALTKWVGEKYVMHWAKTYRMSCAALRLFNVYGPRSRTTGAYGAVFGVFLAQKLAKKPYTVVGDGTQSRDFVFVSDVADAFVRAAASDVSGEAFNVGAGRPQTVNKLVELLGGEKTHLPKRPGEPDCTWADVRKIEKTLGWKSKTKFEDGVRIMLEHINLWKDAPVWDEKSIAAATKDWFEHLGREKAGAK